MGTFHETIPPTIQAWILQQKVFYIASAPLDPSGHINLSPKGGSYFGILSPTQFWYIDLTGSGVETLAHLNEPGNGRITVMFNAFEGAPRIVRLWGRGEVLEVGTEGFVRFVREQGIKLIPGVRAVVLVHIHQVGSSCGFSMPKYEFKEFRPTLNEFFEKRVASEEAGRKEDGIERYWAYKNALSMDNIPGLRRGYATAEKDSVKPIKKMVGPLAKEPFIPGGKKGGGSGNGNGNGDLGFNQVVLVVLMALLVAVAVACVLAVEGGWLGGAGSGNEAGGKVGGVSYEEVAGGRVGANVGGGGGGGGRREL